MMFYSTMTTTTMTLRPRKHQRYLQRRLPGLVLLHLLVLTLYTRETMSIIHDNNNNVNEDHVVVPSYDVPLPFDMQLEDFVITYLHELSKPATTEISLPNENDTNNNNLDDEDGDDDDVDVELDRNIHHHSDIRRRRRFLEIGDFQRFNELFANAQLILPPAEVSESGLTLNIENLICTGITVGDIQSNYTVFTDTTNNQETLAYTVSAYPISITCSADYTFKILFANGKGRFTAVAENTRAETRIDLVSDNTFMNGPPTTASVEYCNAAINTNGNIQFEGATLQRLLTLFKQLISNLVDKYAAEAVCNLLSESGPELFNNLLNQTQVRLNTWLQLPETDELTNPLYVEQNYVVPDNVTLIHFQSPDTTSTTTGTNSSSSSSSSSIGEIFVRFLKEADTLFGKTVIDPVTGEADLGINTFLRKTLIDSETGAWIVDLAQFTTFNPVLFESHDKLTQSSISITGIKVVGIDTLQTFNPFIDIGAYTVSNALTWEALSMEVALTVDIKPSTRSDSILYNPDPVNIVEEIIIRIDFTNINVDLAIFMPIDETKFENIALGSVLSTNYILPCFVSALTALEVSGMNVTIADVGVPTLEGFVSPGIDRIVSQLAEAAFLVYEPTLIRAIPGLFQGPIRTMLKTRLLDSLLDVGDTNKCPLVNIESPDDSNAPVMLDFRDLFLRPNDAVTVGASGQQPYGNVGYFAYEMIQERFIEIGTDGLPKINEILIGSFTKTQSGVSGLIQFPKTLFEFGSNSSTNTMERFLVEDNPLFSTTGGLQFRLGDVRVTNVNSINLPMEILNVTDDSSVLRNQISMGVGSPVNITFRVSSGFNDQLNEIDITVALESLSVATDIRATVDANRFLQFPLGNVLNYNCWLAVLPSIQLNSDGIAADPTSIRSLSVVNFASSISSIVVSTQCITCTSPGPKLLPELIQILDDVEAIRILGDRLPSLLDSLAMSSTTQTFFDRIVSDAPKFCPSSPTYSVDAVKTSYDGLGFPTLTNESIDTLIYTGILAAEVAFIVFAETQRQSNTTLTSPLSAQDSFIPPDNIRLIDWTNIGNSTGLGATADQVFDQLRNFLGGTEGSGFDFDRILGGLPNDDGSFELQTNIEWENGGIVAALDSVRIRGLDNFSLVDILEPIGEQTLRVSAQFDTLDINLELTVGVPSSADPPQRVAISLSMQNASASIALFVAIDLDKLGALKLGSLFETKSIVQCLLSTAHAFEIPQMRVSIGSFTNPTIDGLLTDTGDTITLATETLFDRYKSDIIEAIPKIFDGVGKDFLSKLLDLPDERSCEAVIREPPEGAIVDFRDLLLPQNESISLGGTGEAQYGNLISSIFTLLKEELFATDPKSGLAVINTKLIDDLTETQSGTPGRLYFPGDLLNSERRVQAGGLDAKVRLRAHDAYINNLDTIGTPLTIFEPLDGQPTMLSNSAVIGVNRTVQLGIRFFFGISNEDSDIRNDLDIRLDMKSLQVLLTALATVSEKALTHFPIQDILNLQCWLATMPAPALDSRGVRVNETDASLAVTEFMASIATLALSIICLDCSSPRIIELTELLSSNAGSDAVTDVANELFDLLPKLVEGNFLTVAIDRALNDAKMRCPHSSQYDPKFSGVEYEDFDIASDNDSVSFFLALLIVGLILVVATLSVLLTTKCIVRRRHRAWIRTLEKTELNLIWKEQQKFDDRNHLIDQSTKSMFRSEAIPHWIRWTIPMVVLANIAFFLSGHLSLAASVTILASVGGQTFSEEGFFEFSVAKSTIEIWNAGGQELAVLIFIFSFAWPYAKTLLTLALWFVQPSTLSVKRRGSILLWLDFLAKWSTIDIFVLIVTIVSFRVSVKSPDVEFLPTDFYSLDLLVSPKWGLYANLMAQVISQISSHFIIHYHRRIVEEAIKNEESDFLDIVNTRTAIMDDDCDEIDNVPVASETFINTDIVRMGDTDRAVSIINVASENFEQVNSVALEQTKNQLSTFAFKRPHRGESDKLVIRRFVNPMLVALASCCILLVILGCVLPSYSVSAYGIVGILVESGQKFSAAESSYSAITTISLLFEQAKLTGTAADFVGLGSLAIIMLLSVLFAPIAQSLVLLIQWFIPLTRKRRYRLMILLEILQAWQYAEVYLLAIIVGSWQLGPISDYMINPYCNSLRGFFSDLVYYGILKDEDAQCFKTDVQVMPTFYLLFSGAIVLALINSFVMRAVSQYFRDCTASPLENLRNMNRDKLANFDSLGGIESVNQDEMEVGKIHPVPVLFTDQYRWLLQRKEIPPTGISLQSSESFVISDGFKEPSCANSSELSEDLGLNYMRKSLCVETGSKISEPDEQSFADLSIYTSTNDPN